MLLDGVVETGSAQRRMQQWHMSYGANYKKKCQPTISTYCIFLMLNFFSLQATKSTHNLLINSEILSILIGHWVWIAKKAK
jgi:hypothetical protein